MLAGLLELAVYTDKGILVEAGIGFEARFGLGAAFVDREIMVEETEFPFMSFCGLSMLEGMSTTLCFFDELAVGYAAG